MPDTLDRLQPAVGASYRIQRELGAGGMAIVYRVLHTADWDWNAADSAFRRAFTLVPGTPSGTNGTPTFCLPRVTTRKQRRSWLAPASSTRSPRLKLPFEAARWRMKAGDLDGMFRDLDRAFEARTGWMPAVKWYINTPAAKHDPRYRALLARLKIPEDAQ